MDSFDNSVFRAWRARDKRLITVPTGTPKIDAGRDAWLKAWTDAVLR